MKLELVRGCTGYGIFIDDKRYYDVPKPEIREILVRIMNQVDERSLYYILEGVLDSLGEYYCEEDACEQCGDTIETYTLEL